MEKRIVSLVTCLAILPAVLVADPDPNVAPNQIVTTTKVIPHFTAVEIKSKGNLYIKQSDVENLTIEAENKVLPDILVDVKNDILTIGFRSDSVKTEADVNYYLTIKDIQSITTAGNTNVVIKEGLKTDNFTLSLNGVGIANIKISVGAFTTNIAGSAQVDAVGDAGTQTIAINGAGDFDGSHLVGKTAAVSIDGSGTIKTNISDNLDVRIGGLGEVGYCGKPAITQKISGSGVIKALDSKACS